MGTSRRFVRIGLAAGLLLAPALTTSAAAAAPLAPSPLVGTFAIRAGECTGAPMTGTYLRLILPSGNESGPFVGNGDSPCDDQTFTPLSPGTDGGLLTGGYQPNPDPAFDGGGNGLADRITAPAQFFGVAFSTSTNPVDPQTQLEVPAPTITVDGTALGGDLSAFAATWNSQQFNQGAPKPDGQMPGLTAAPTGTYDPATGAFVLEWRSHIEGGPFNSFTGVWHLEGTFLPASGSTSTPPPTSDAANGPGAATPGAPASSLPSTGGTLAPGSTVVPAGTAAVSTSVAPGLSSVPTSPGAPAIDLAVVGDEEAAAGAPGDDSGGDRGAFPVVLAVLTLAGAAALLFRQIRTGGGQS